ncbi:putative quinol monooxygenase [Microbacterium saperdae]|uniref:Quinol monooxygenase YgiN n=1 Tax=Microbacterium saperdae TaxID=69368 RepID=A0A543BI92_9MICO|nr:putative quinol monooxygenase [Microbacterium saperdae]TQL84521.1 quinol monooxygenase YgiN [Microbacterium saperdae]GGM61030.1 (4S)-4-hydroxy-5-phosphonooxypentane-2,3-dione isomerase [Microbacterium saperdae]
MSEPTILHATFTARPGEGDRVAALLRDFAEGVRAEDGNVVFDATRLVDDSDRFFVYEVYRDDEAFQAHLASPAGVPFNAALQELIVEPSSQLTFLRRL